MQTSVVYVPLLVSALSLVMCVFSFLYVRSYIKRRTSQERILAELREEVNGLLKSIDETTERDISLVEERERRLKALLADVEKRLKVFVREVERHKEAETNYAALAPLPPKTALAGGDAYLDLGRNRYRGGAALSPGESSCGESAAIAGVSRAGEVESTAPDSAAPENDNPAFPLPRFRVKPETLVPENTAPPKPVSTAAEIRELLRAGFAAPAVAARVGVSIAEVEFAAALLERRDEEP